MISFYCIFFVTLVLGLVSASQMSNDGQLEEVIQKLFDSVLAEREVFSKKESDLFPCGKAEKMAEFSDIYREKFAQEYHELNQVVPQMQSTVENLQDDVFTAGKVMTKCYPSQYT